MVWKTFLRPETARKPTKKGRKRHQKQRKTAQKRPQKWLEALPHCEVRDLLLRRLPAHSWDACCATTLRPSKSASRALLTSNRRKIQSKSIEIHEKTMENRWKTMKKHAKSTKTTVFGAVECSEFAQKACRA